MGMKTGTGLTMLLFLVLTIVMLYPLSLYPAGLVANQGDPLLNSWILAWVSKTLFTTPLSLFHGNIFYPFPYSLAFSEVLVGSVFIAAPVIWLTGNPVLAHNVVTLASFFLSSLGAYLLTQHLTRSAAAGIVAGVIFAFAPYKFAHMGHVQLLTAHWMPFALLFLHRAWAGRRWRDFLAFAACFALQALSSFYYAVFFALAVVLFGAYFAVGRRHELRAELALKLVAASVVAGSVVLPFALPYFQAQGEYGHQFVRTLTEAQNWSADVQDYFVAPPENILYGGLTAPLRNQQQIAERFLFPGLLPPLLALAGLLSVRPLRKTRALTGNRAAAAGEPPTGFVAQVGDSQVQGYYLLLAASSFLMSLGPSLRAFGAEIAVPLPYLFFFEHMPGAKALRVPARFDILVMLAVAVLAGYGMTRVVGGLSRAGARRVRGLGFASVLTGMVVLEYASFPVPTVPIEVGSQVPAVYRWLGEQEVAAVVELPAGLEHDYRYEYFSTFHWRRIVNGQSGFEPQAYTKIREELQFFPAEYVVTLLRWLGVDVVILHGDLYSAERWQEIRAGLAASADLALVGSFGNDYLYRIAPSNPIPGQTVVNASLPLVVASGQSFVVPVSVASAPAKVRAEARWTGSQVKEQRSVSPLALTPDGDVWQAPLELTAPDNVGRYQLALRLDTLESVLAVTGQLEVVDMLPASFSAADYGAALGPCTAPRQVKTGSVAQFSCSVRNDGRSVWFGRTAEPRGQVGLGIRGWRGPDGEYAPGSDGHPLTARSGLPWSIWPGQVVTLTMTAQVPAWPGPYTARLDMLSERVFWFEDVGASSPFEVAVWVE